MKIVEAMSSYVEFIGADAPVSEAAELMGELDVGGLPVGAPDRLEGVVTDRDLLYRVVARGSDASAVRVRDVMSRPVIACHEDDTVRAVLDMMASHHIRRMPVLDASDKVTGWVTLADLSRKLLVEDPALQNALRHLTEAE